MEATPTPTNPTIQYDNFAKVQLRVATVVECKPHPNADKLWLTSVDATAFELGQRAVLAGEFDLRAIVNAVPDRYTYAPVPRVPAALRDIAIIVDEPVTAEQVVKEVLAAGRPLLRQARLFDLYRGESIPAGKKSLAYALTYQAGDRTLTDKDVDKAHKKIEDRLKHVLKAQIRGKDTTS